MLFSPSRALSFLALFERAAGARPKTICGQKSYTVDSGSDKFIFNPNAWRPHSDGFQCMTIQDSPPAFDATWFWPSDAATVHSYPHVKLASPSLPVPLSNISALLLSAKWSMGPGSEPHPLLDVDTAGLSEQETTANVAFDLFADQNAANANNEQIAETEIMFWLGMFGHAQPLGYGKDRTCFGTQVISDVEFILYQGKNERGTNVFSWVANTTRTSFAGEVSPLLQYLWRNGLISAGTNIGVVSFGTEAFTSTQNVTFSSSDFKMSLVTGAAPTLEVPGLPDNCSGYSPAGSDGPGGSGDGDESGGSDSGGSGDDSSGHCFHGSRLSTSAIFAFSSVVVYLGHLFS